MTATERDPVAALAAEPAGSAPLLRVRGLGITHEGATIPAPASVSFDIAAGEVVLLLGPSGSGKSTLTLALNGLIPHALPADVVGTVAVGGDDTLDTTVAELSTRVGMVFQDPDTQLVTGTILDEVAFGPENLRMPVAEVLARSESALRRVGLWDRRTENPDRLSGGGRQRLAIACALAMGSPLLVLDEPTANLDPRGIEEVYAALAEVVSAGDRADPPRRTQPRRCRELHRPSRGAGPHGPPDGRWHRRRGAARSSLGAALDGCMAARRRAGGTATAAGGLRPRSAAADARGAARRARGRAC